MLCGAAARQLQHSKCITKASRQMVCQRSASQGVRDRLDSTENMLARTVTKMSKIRLARHKIRLWLPLEPKSLQRLLTLEKKTCGRQPITLHPNALRIASALFNGGH